jgi:hypothetical protein
LARLQSIGEDIWICEGGNVNFFGFAYPTRMIIIRLPDKSLWVWSPILIDGSVKNEVAAIGPVGHLVSPNKIHHLFLSEWSAAFPQAKLWGPASTIAKRKDLDFEPALSNEPPEIWGGQIDVFHFTGSAFMDELVFFHTASSTAILADLSENFGADFVKKNWRGWQVFLAKFWGIMAGKAPLEWRLSFTNKKPARAARNQLLALNPERVIMAHGEWQRQNGRKFLEQSLAWLG